MSEELPLCWICNSDARTDSYNLAGCKNPECENATIVDRETWIARAENHRLKVENQHLRALVKRVGELDRTHVGEELDTFCEERRTDETVAHHQAS